MLSPVREVARRPVMTALSDARDEMEAVDEVSDETTAEVAVRLAATSLLAFALLTCKL
jgi:hypothetical protein